MTPTATNFPMGVHPNSSEATASSGSSVVGLEVSSGAQNPVGPFILIQPSRCLPGRREEVAELMKRVSSETAERVNNSKSFKGCFYAVIDRENMARSGVYPKWREAEHVKKSAGSGYAAYGTSQESIEGALEELNDMIENYNSVCSMHKDKQWE